MTNDSDLILLPLLIIDTDSDKIKSSFLISTFAAAKVEIKNDDLILSESVSIIKSGNKIKSESLVIKLKR